MGDERPELEFDDELAAVDEVREELSDEEAVRHVSLGPTLDEEAGELVPSVWVHATDEADATDEVAEVPVERFEVPEAGDPYDPCRELCRRADPPRGGFEISPDPGRKPAAGSLGLVGRRPGEGDPMMVTAAHTFATGQGYLQQTRQPLSTRQADRISDRPVRDATQYDLLGFRLDPDARDWRRRSEVAQVSGTVTGLATPNPGDRVVNVGRTSGRTEGTLVYVNPPWFGVRASDERRPVTHPGDSGGPWVTPPSLVGNPQWVGIHLQKLTTGEGWISVGLLAGYVEELLGFRLF